MSLDRTLVRRLAGLVSLAVFATLMAACAAPEPAPAPEEAPPAPREVARYTIEDFLDTTSYGGSYFSPDKSKLLVHSDASGIFNAYAIPVAGGDPEQLTDSTVESIFVLGYFPDDERFLYMADEGGNELDHIYVRELDGSTVDLTPGDELKAQFLGFAHDGESLYVTTNERDPRYFDAYEIELDGYERSLVFENTDGYFLGDFSNDGRYLALAKMKTRNDSDVHLFDRESGETRHLTPHEGDVAFSPAAFSPDGTSFYMTTDEGSEFDYLIRQDLETGERETVLEPGWDVMFAGFSHGGRYLLVGTNADAKTELTLHDAATLEPVPLPELPQAAITGARLSRDEGHIAFYASTGRQPSDLYVAELGDGESGPGEPRQLTRSLSEAIAPEDLVEGEVVRFDSFDGVEIPGILYRPHQASPESKVPALVWVHGGPGGQSRLGYSALIQYLVNHGYMVYAINNRGSSGYGKTFEALDNRAHGEGDLDDCVAAKSMLIDTGVVDEERIGILGGSYGGYMVLAALAFRPEAFDVGVDIFGVSNWVRTLNSIPAWWEAQRRLLEVEMGDFDDEEYFRSISPLFHAENIARPLLVLQGANDPRVLKAESDEIVAAVEANGVPVEYVVFDDEGHGFAKKENRIEGYKAIRTFLDEYLKSSPVSPTG